MTTMTAEPINSLTWRRHGLCRDQWELFDGFTEMDRNDALDLCAVCPVLAHYREDVRTWTTPPLGVVAGIYYGK